MGYNEVGGLFKNIILLTTIWVSNYIIMGTFTFVICIIIVNDPFPPLILTCLAHTQNYCIVRIIHCTGTVVNYRLLALTIMTLALL